METLNDYLPTTPDLNAERLADLRRLWPDLFTNEGKPDFEALRQVMQDADSENVGGMNPLNATLLRGAANLPLDAAPSPPPL